jgi:2-oxo-3-hexenedioate decarboxylase
MGVTSREKMAQVGITEVIWGRLTDAMLMEDGDTLDVSRFIHPRAEPEIVFRLGKSLAGKVTEMEAWAAIDGVAAGIEILDSRFKNFKFSITDVVADNASSSALLIGPWNKPTVDFANLGMSLEVNGRPVGVGSSAAILGHPIRSLVAGARLAAQYGDSLQPGDVFLSGAATAAEPLRPGSNVRVRIEKLGRCGFSVSALRTP